MLSFGVCCSYDGGFYSLGLFFFLSFFLVSGFLFYFFTELRSFTCNLGACIYLNYLNFMYCHRGVAAFCKCLQISIFLEAARGTSNQSEQCVEVSWS